MSKITAYGALTTPQFDDVLPVVDIHDTTMAPTGTTKKITIGNLTASIAIPPSGDSTGATDPAALNAAISAMAALGGGTVHGVPSAPWYLNTPIVMKSNVTLDMTGCVITEVASSNCNMVTNLAATTTAATGTGGMTSGGNTLTTSLGASAVVGQSVTVAGAANGGANILCGIVGAQTSTTITVVDLYGNALKAEATVSGAAVKLYTRDTKIRVTGGTWNRGSNGFNGGPGFNPLTCSTNFKRVDGLNVGGNGQTWTCTDKGYNVHYGDCSSFRFHDITISAPLNKPNTDGVHGWGPLALGAVDHIYGTCGDDFAIYDCLDPGLTIDVCGYVSDVTISHLYPGQGSSPNGGGGAILIGSGTLPLRRIGVSDIYGSSTTYAVNLDTGATGCIADQIVINRVANASTSNCVGLGATGAGNITLRDIFWPGNASTPSGANMITVQAAANIGALSIDGMTADVATTNVNEFNLLSGGVVESLIVKNVNQTAGSGIVVQIAGTVSNVLSIDGFHVIVTSGTNPAIYVSGTVGRIQMNDVYLKGSSVPLIADASGSVHGQILLSNATLDGAGNLYTLDTAADIVINGLNVTTLSGSLLIWLGAAATTVSVRGAGLVNPNNYPLFGNMGTPTTPPRVVMAEALTDVSAGVSRSHAGDTVFNTNGSLSCGTGVLLSNGSGSSGSWKNLFSGSTY